MKKTAVCEEMMEGKIRRSFYKLRFIWGGQVVMGVWGFRVLGLGGLRFTGFWGLGIRFRVSKGFRVEA